MALREAANYMYHKKNFRANNFFIIGDGIVPKTGSIIAFTRNDAVVTSIDPQMRPMDNIDHLECVTALAEEYDYDKNGNESCFIIAPHCHAPLKQVYARFRETNPTCPITIITLDCCFANNMETIDGVSLVKEYLDMGISSPMRRVKIFQSTISKDV